ncbi:hypothetical protein EK21DRAFT_41687, partial [Setomelanomma holmii]
TPAQVAERLDHVYLNLEVPLFAGLSIDEIDIWMENLPNRVKSHLTHSHNYTLYPKARGVLHRLFNSDFDELSHHEDKGTDFINQWREIDPQIDPTKCPTAPEAYDQMLALYSGTENLPFLKESPLHWPRLKYRQHFKQVTKRKRDGDDETKDPVKKLK